MKLNLASCFDMGFVLGRLELIERIHPAQYDIADRKPIYGTMLRVSELTKRGMIPNEVRDEISEIVSRVNYSDAQLESDEKGSCAFSHGFWFAHGGNQYKPHYIEQ